MSIKYRLSCCLRASIKNINQHSTADDFSTQAQLASTPLTPFWCHWICYATVRLYVYLPTRPYNGMEGYSRTGVVDLSVVTNNLKSFCYFLIFICLLLSYQQFFAWFANVEAQMEEEQESSYRYY